MKDYLILILVTNIFLISIVNNLEKNNFKFLKRNNVNIL